MVERESSPDLDWTNPQHYFYPKTTSRDRWRCEFLARNMAFREEVLGAKAEQEAAKQRGESLSPFWSHTPYGKVLKKWGVAWPLLPEWGLDSPAHFERFPIKVGMFKLKGADDAVHYHLAPARGDRTVLEFDLSAPIAAQLKRAKALLQQEQRQILGRLERFNDNHSLYPCYLRVLDALQAGAAKVQMLEVFSKKNPNIDENTISNWIAAAQRYRDSDYRKI